jgi:outer membrane biosynthesis protein TonB
MERVLDEEPLVFEIEQPPMPTEVIETPDDAKITDNPEKADFLSDKNALARDAEETPVLDPGAPFQRGDYADIHELPVDPGQQGEAGQPSEQQQPQEKQDEPKRKDDNATDYYADTETRDFREYLTEPRKAQQPGSTNDIPKPRYDNQLSSVEDTGGISFNTYDWDFAPYMLQLKRRVERNIFPPPAYTRMGLISGDTVLRFKIYPNGELRDLEVITYKGHHTLMETSVSAIEVSAPFPDLPRDFPEEYLEVTARFSYFGRRDF